MLGDKDQFISLEAKKGGVVTFGDNGKEKIIGFDKISISPFTYIENILLVEGLIHNLLSISQLCDKDFNVAFRASYCIITSSLDGSIKFIEKRHDNVYIVDLDEPKVTNFECLLAMNAKSNDSN